jgi:tetratricopeptide (TPR) repeat protein
LEEAMGRGEAAASGGDWDEAASQYEQAEPLASLVLQGSDPRSVYVNGQVKQGLASSWLARGEPLFAIGFYDEAEAFFVQPVIAGQTGPEVCRLRVRRARAHSEMGAGLSAMLDVQRAATGMATVVERTHSSDDAAELGFVLAAAAPVIAAHGSLLMTAAAAGQAIDILRSAQSLRVTSAGQIPAFLRLALVIQARVFLSQGRDDAYRSTVEQLGEDRFDAEIAAELARRYDSRPGLTDAVWWARERSDSGPAALLARMLADRDEGASVPAWLTDDEYWFVAASQAGQLMDSALRDEPALIAGAGLDAVCMFAHAHENHALDALEWHDRRVMLVEWARQSALLASLAVGSGDTALSRDYLKQALAALKLTQAGPLADHESRLVEQVEEQIYDVWEQVSKPS